MNLEQIVTELTEAWNAGDAERWAAAFAEDGLLVDVMGRFLHGRRVIAEEYRKLFDTVLKDSRLDLREPVGKPLGADVVLAYTVGTITVPAGPRAGATEGVLTMVVRNELVEAFQTTIRTTPEAHCDHDADFVALEPLGLHPHDVTA